MFTCRCYSFFQHRISIVQFLSFAYNAWFCQIHRHCKRKKICESNLLPFSMLTGNIHNITYIYRPNLRRITESQKWTLIVEFELVTPCLKLLQLILVLKTHTGTKVYIGKQNPLVQISYSC